MSLLIVSLLIFSCTLILHYGSHFRLRCCIRSKLPFGTQQQNLSKRNSLRIHSNNLMRQIKQKENICRCCLIGVEHETWDFFPLSFFFYNIYVILLSILILSKYTIISSMQSNHQLFNVSFLNYHANDNNKYNNHNYPSIIDWIIVYSLILLSIWESLFNFYRFYSTCFASSLCQSVQFLFISSSAYLP